MFYNIWVTSLDRFIWLIRHRERGQIYVSFGLTISFSHWFSMNRKAWSQFPLFFSFYRAMLLSLLICLQWLFVYMKESMDLVIWQSKKIQRSKLWWCKRDRTKCECARVVTVVSFLLPFFEKFLVFWFPFTYSTLHVRWIRCYAKSLCSPRLESSFFLLFSVSNLIRCPEKNDPFKFYFKY